MFNHNGFLGGLRVDLYRSTLPLLTTV